MSVGKSVGSFGKMWGELEWGTGRGGLGVIAR